MIQKLKQIALTEESKKLKRRFDQFNYLIDEINKKEISDDMEKQFSELIDGLNSHSGTAKLLAINIRRVQTKMLRSLEKELKTVPKNHYRNSWMAIGMSVFGIPLGVGLGASMGNMGLLGIGLPIGMVIGMVIGNGMDKKAAEEGRQLDIEIKL